MKRTAYNPATARTYYMDNTGHRAISIDANGNRPRVLVKWSADAEPKPVAVKFWEACGNWSITNVREPRTGRIVAVCPQSDAPTAEAMIFAPYEVKRPQA